MKIPIRNRVLIAALCTVPILIHGALLFGQPDQPPKSATAPVRFEPSSQPVINEMLRIASVTNKDLVYDLGCGDGRIVITAARAVGARGVGVDIDPALIAESRKNAERSNVSHLLQFRTEDLYMTDIHRATVVMLFLSPEANLALRPRLLKELKPGTRVVSHCHTMGDWKPDSESEVEYHRIYCWTVPSAVSGRWRMEVMDKYARSEYVLEFVQRYQEIRATLRSGAEFIPVAGAKLRGKTISFTTAASFGSLGPGVECRGEVQGERIAGTCRSGKQSRSWNAGRFNR